MKRTMKPHKHTWEQCRSHDTSSKLLRSTRLEPFSICSVNLRFSIPNPDISAFTSCVGALSTFSTCHLDFFHQDHSRLDDDDAAGGGTVFSVSSISLQKLSSLFEILEWTVFFSDKTETGFPAKTTRWPNKFTCTLKINSKTLVHFFEEKVLNADSNLMVKQLLDPR